MQGLVGRNVPRLMRHGFLALILVVATSSAFAQGGWELDARFAPPPEAASPELREMIDASPKPSVALRKVAAPASEEAWRNLIDSQDAQRALPLEVLEEEFQVAIERDTIAGVPVYRVTPVAVAPAHEGHLFLHVHGGAYVFGGGDNAVYEAAVVAGGAKIPALSIDYRMPPDHPFPAAVEDVVAVYRTLLKERSARSMVMGGTSAGGGLALAAVHDLMGQGIKPPGALYAGTPWADLTKTGDTQFTNEGLDRMLVTYHGLLESAAQLYGAGHDLKDPRISPVYGDFAGFPPTYLVTGTRDLFLSDTARTHRAMRSAGVTADLNVFEGMSHAEYLFLPDSPETQQLLAELSDFFETHLTAN